MHAVLLCCLLHITANVQVGFAETDITPKLESDTPVWMAGYYPGRRATDIHDRLMCRAVVVNQGEEKIALASVDLIGLQRPDVLRIRKKLSDFNFVMVSSTHSHEGPDVIGIWGPSYIQRGVNDEYVTFVIEQVALAIRNAEKNLQETTEVKFGVAEDETLLKDNRLPKVIDGKIRTLQFLGGEKSLGILVVWNCHPEAMGPDNTSLTGDFVASTVESLKRKYKCPVAYFTGSVGGLMAPPHKRIYNDQKEELKEGDFKYAQQYGIAVADLAVEALQASNPIELTPIRIASSEVAIPVENKYYRAAGALNVVIRPSYKWLGDYKKWGKEVDLGKANGENLAAALTEVSCLQLGQLTAICVPGEIYPELTLGKVQDPAEKNADYPDAPIEPSIAELFPNERKLIFGLANDEMGYFLPKRQWDSAPPYAYGKKATQYGEINSCSPEAGPIIMQSLKDLAAQINK